MQKNFFYFVNKGNKVTLDGGNLNIINPSKGNFFVKRNTENDKNIYGNGNFPISSVFEIFNGNNDYEFKKDLFDILFFQNDRIEVMVWLESEETEIPRNISNYSNKNYTVELIQFEIKKQLKKSDIEPLSKIKNAFKLDIYCLREDKFVEEDFLKKYQPVTYPYLINCVVCGLFGPWEEKEICHCCGCKFGYHDILGKGILSISSEFEEKKLRKRGSIVSRKKIEKYNWSLDKDYLKFCSIKDLQAVLEYRKRWLQGRLPWQKTNNLFKWFKEKYKPKGYDRFFQEKQLQCIPFFWK